LVEEDCRRAVDGCQSVICAVGVHSTRWQGQCVDGDGIINLARAAEQSGVRHFILVSSLGVGDSMEWMPIFVKAIFRLFNMAPLLCEKARSEAYVRASGLAWTILRPGLLHGGQMRSDPVLTVTGRVPGITGRQAVADVAVRCLLSDKAHACILVIADGWLRPWLQGEPYQLNVPWTRW
jgi:uncharacterized protein YbjT (DUF2867 family)